MTTDERIQTRIPILQAEYSAFQQNSAAQDLAYQAVLGELRRALTDTHPEHDIDEAELQNREQAKLQQATIDRTAIEGRIAELVQHRDNYVLEANEEVKRINTAAAELQQLLDRGMTAANSLGA